MSGKLLRTGYTAKKYKWLITGLLFARHLVAQQPVTLAQAVELAVRNYPSIKISQEQMNATAAGIELARTAYLPRVDALAQVNRATRNNVFGVLLPQSIVPPMSGPVIGSNNLGSVWGSAVGALVTWEPFDFGLRSASVAAAGATKARSEAVVKRSQFDVAAAAADAYLTLVAASETVKAAQAGVDRARTITRTIAAQVKAQLRPGADESRAEAELAAAKTQLIQAQQATEVAKATLAQFTLLEPSQIQIDNNNLTQLPAEQTAAPLRAELNPIAMEQSAIVEQAVAQLRTLERSYFPRFYLQAAANARGTGADTDGARLGGLNGLAPTTQDYAVGFTATFPIMDFASLRAREAAQNATIRSEKARAQQITLELKAQWNRAVAVWNGARLIAGNTPVQVSAARMATTQATARYQAGLGIIDDVAEAQRLLTQAEIDDALARLNVWRGLLGIATAAGDIKPFVASATP
jgi:outer membrane protein